MVNIVKLSSLKEKEKSVIFLVEEINQKMNRRLIELGFVKNEKVEVIKNLKRGKNMLIAIRGYVLSLDYFIASKIMVYKKGV